MSPSQQAFSPTVELEMLDQGQIALVTLADVIDRLDSLICPLASA